MQPLTSKQRELLTSDPTDAEIDVLPTGELYVPHQHIRARLNAAIGAGMWRMVELGDPVLGGTEVIWRWRLEFANGWSASTVGHAKYNKDNPRGSYGDALETCKSDALVRAVKDLGFGTVLLNRQWKEGWRSQHCRLVYRVQTNSLHWRRNDTIPWEDESNPDQDDKGYLMKRIAFAEEIKTHWASLTEKRPDSAALDRAEAEFGQLVPVDPWDEAEEARRVVAEDELFRAASREEQ